jgi:serine/threonine protein kinase
MPEGTMLVESQVINGKYRIVEEIDQGDLGPVYQAVDVESGEVCTLRLISLVLGSDTSTKGLLVQEAASVEKLHHPHVMPFGEVSETDDGQTFAVRPFIEGRTLADLLRLEGRLSLERASHIGQQIASALEAAHNAGMVHGNLQPANVLLTVDKEKELVKVLGFGTFYVLQSRFLDMARLAVSEPGHLLGAAEYISPELATGTEAKTLDGRSDIYSLGMLLYEMLAGETPFHGKSTMEVLLAQLFDDPTPLRKRRDLQIPEVLETLVMRTIAKNRKDRPASATVLVDQLRPWEEDGEPSLSPVTEAAHSDASRPGSAAQKERAAPGTFDFPPFVPKSFTQRPSPVPPNPPRSSLVSEALFSRPDASERDDQFPDFDSEAPTQPARMAQMQAPPGEPASPSLRPSASRHTDFEPDLANTLRAAMTGQKPADINFEKQTSANQPGGQGETIIYPSSLPTQRAARESRRGGHVWATAIVIILLALGGVSDWLYVSGRTYWFQPHYVMSRVASLIGMEASVKGSTPQARQPASAPSPASSQSSVAPATPNAPSRSPAASLHRSPARAVLRSATSNPTKASNSVFQAKHAGAAALAPNLQNPEQTAGAEDQSSEIEDVIRRGNYYFLLGKYDDAIRVFQNALKQNPSNPRLLAEIARAQKAKAAEAEFLGRSRPLQ